MAPNKLETRLGPLAWEESGTGPPLVFFAGALANRELWRDVIAALADRYHCIAIDLPLGAHEWPTRAGADRSAASLARLELDCLDLLEVEGATVVANDTAGGLLLLFPERRPGSRSTTRSRSPTASPRSCRRPPRIAVCSWRGHG